MSTAAEHPAPGTTSPPTTPATPTIAPFVQRLRDQIGSGDARFGVVDLHELRVVLNDYDKLDRLRRSDVEPDWDEDGVTGWMGPLDIELDATSTFTPPEIRVRGHIETGTNMTVHQVTQFRDMLDTVIRRAAL